MTAAVGTSTMQQPQQVIPQIRRRSDSVSSSSSVECIGHTPASEESRARNSAARLRRLNVNQTISRRSNRSRGPVEIITINTDSDDEPNPIVVAPRPPEPRRQRRSYRSPPPPPADDYVPPLPRHLMLPRVQSPAVHVPPPAIPAVLNIPRLPPVQSLPLSDNVPFDFEDPEPRAVPQRGSNLRPPGPIHMHRNQLQPFPEVALAPRLGLGGGLIGGRGRHHAVGTRAVNERHIPLAFHLARDRPRAQWSEYLRTALLPMANLYNDLFYNNYTGAAEAPSREGSPDYQPEWTHPDKPQPGFSYTFTDESTTIIMDNGGTLEEKQKRGVCPHCHQLLVTNGTDEDGKRIYALRCGHMIDAHCLQILTSSDNGYPTVDKKGKGKARVDYFEPMNGEEEQGQGTGHYHLRQRHSVQGNGKAPRGRKSAKGGKRGRKRGPDIIAQRYWKCPVCQKAHVSVQYDDSPIWVQDKERGAIAMFV